MGVLGSIFKYAIECAISGNSETVYDVNFAGFYDDLNFRKCFHEYGNPIDDGGTLIRQICAFGLMRLIQENELKKYKDDYISCIANRMPHFDAYVAQCIQEGKEIMYGISRINKFVNLDFDDQRLQSATVQVQAESGHPLTMKIRFPSGLFNVYSDSLEMYSRVPGFRRPSSY